MILRLSLNCNILGALGLRMVILLLRANPGGSVLASPCGVLRRCYRQLGHLSSLPLGMQLSEKRNTPLASGTRAKAVGQLASHPWPLPLHEVDQLALAHPKAEAHMVIWIHELVRRLRRRTSAGRSSGRHDALYIECKEVLKVRRQHVGRFERTWGGPRTVDSKARAHDAAKCKVTSIDAITGLDP